jgi:hypothetical protein
MQFVPDLGGGSLYMDQAAEGVWRQKTRYGWAAVAPGHVQCAKMARPGTCAATVVYYIFAR